jgi:predicted nucleotidyltransferase
VHIANRNLTLGEVIAALRQYRDKASDKIDLSQSAKVGVLVSLIRRLLSTQLDYINIAKKYFEIPDFFAFLDRTIYSADSHGRLGGKCAGLFLAQQIISKNFEGDKALSGIRIPKSWYMTSDILLGFLRYNNMDEVVEQKYKDINRVRVEYPNVIRSFKNGRFPPEIVSGLSMVLDECVGKPLIIRSSSLLEDSLGASFSGKYKSLFLANQGTKQERLEALMDAVAEIYASTFGPDPIEYRAERGLLDFAEEMGIMIQEVVGTRIGDYFMPAFAGVAFSRNEFRWSPRIRREDGLIRLVPGLGTRAVDRVSDDYPVLVAPGQPDLRVNVAPDEIEYYSPKMIDVINLRNNTFETVKISELLKKYGDEYPNIEKMVLVNKDGHIHKPLRMSIDFENDDLLMTFEGLLSDTPFLNQVRSILKVLEETIDTPVDIEFAHDGKDFYLLQCRPQSYSEDTAPAPIPQDIPEAEILFSADKFVSNGRVPDITHVVYVDPIKYGELSSHEELIQVGLAIGKLNKLLPKRQFILMGPGRWGSRGDIRLGVNVTYSDINNTAVRMEIARGRNGYKPDLSFGTHFFQDLVEGQIRYLPLYPDDEGTTFNDRFFSSSTNLLADVLPEHSELSDTIRLIDVPREKKGRVLRILMNADLCKAVGILADPTTGIEETESVAADQSKPTDHLWMWRLRMAEHIASQLDPARFGVAALYVFGSTKNATAGLASDIDLIVHFRGTEHQLEELKIWFEAWSLCLDEINYLRTGYRAGGLLDIHIVTDEDIENKSSFAVKIGAVTDAARPLKLKEPDGS